MKQKIVIHLLIQEANEIAELYKQNEEESFAAFSFVKDQNLVIHQVDKFSDFGPIFPKSLYRGMVTKWCFYAMFFSQQFCKVFTPNDAFIPCFLKSSESNNFLSDQIEEQVPIQVCKTIDKQRTPIVIGKGR